MMGTKFLCVVTNALFVLVFLLLPSCFFDVLMVGNATSFGPKFVCMVIFSKICVVFSFVLVLRVLLVLLKTFLFPYTRVYGLSRVGYCGFVIMFFCCDRVVLAPFLSTKLINATFW